MGGSASSTRAIRSLHTLLLLFCTTSVMSLRAAPLQKIIIAGSGVNLVNGAYVATPATEVPRGFNGVCVEQGWNTSQMWQKLNAGKTWFKAENEAYIYWNHADRHWWIDRPDGAGVYKALGPDHTPPQDGWKLLGSYAPAPTQVKLEY